MEISTKNCVIGLIVAVAVGAAFGYFEAPTKTETKIEVRTVEKEVIKWKEREKTEENKDLVTIIIETILPDGTIHRETRIADKGTIKIDKSKEGSDDKSKETDKIVDTVTESKKTDWSASALVSPSDIKFTSVTYGLLVERRIIGPFKVGAFGLTDKTYGLSVGMGF